MDVEIDSLKSLLKKTRNNITRTQDELEYLMYSNYRPIKKKPELSDFNLSDDILEENQFLEAEQIERIEVFNHYVGAGTVFTISILFIFFSQLDIVELLCMAILVSLICFKLIVLILNRFNIPYRDKEILEINNLFEEYQNSLDVYNYQQKMKCRKRWEKMSGREFEIATAQFFKRKGYKVELTQCSNDGGVDIILFNNGLKIYVQCKHYKNFVGVATARELYGVMQADGVKSGILVTLNGYTQGVHNFVSDKNIKLLTFDDLIEEMVEIQTT